MTTNHTCLPLVKISAQTCEEPWHFLTCSCMKLIATTVAPWPRWWPLPLGCPLPGTIQKIGEIEHIYTYTYTYTYTYVYIYIFTHTYIHTYTFRTWHTQGQHPSPEGSEQRAESASGDTWLDDIFFSPCIYSIMCLAILTWAHTWWKRGFLKWGISKSPWLSMLQWSSMTWMIWGTPI